MATLVLQTVGAAVGGPLGGAIGALIGQKLDSRLLGGAARKGPRLGDLSVQGSRYGSAIPAIYGRMRVAGTIIWATDLEESEAVTGAKGQPDRVTYSYKANLAVALSSRVTGAIGRIWADGKLLRGAAGDLKVAGVMRVLDGGEEQDVDPLMASIDGAVPAYRDYLMVVFEGLELAQFGNRIPLLTFEILAGDDLTTGSLLAEASGGFIDAPTGRAIEGYAVHGQTIGDALQPVLDLLDQPLRDEGGRLRLRDGKSVDIEARMLDATLDETRSHRIEKVRADAEMPSVLRLDYYDASLDYQAGRSMARAFGGRRDVTIDAPMVLSALEARHWAEETLRKQWRTRRTLEIDILPSAMTVQPGDEVRLGSDDTRWQVTSVELDRFSVKVSARWIGERIEADDLPVDAGQNVGAPDVVRAPTKLALFEPPDLNGTGSGRLLLAAANASPGWVATPIELSVGSQWDVIQSAGRESVSGKCKTVLPPATTAFIDARSSVIVELVDPEANLVSVGDEALLAGSNLAMIGAELLQFGRAEALGGGRFALSRFLRGRRGCEAEVAHHQEGEDFVLMDATRMVSIPLESERVGTLVRANPAGLADDNAQEHEIIFEGIASRPLSPVHLSSYEQDGALTLGWTRRDRNGFGWMDNVDAPLSEGREAYRVEISGSAGALVDEAAASAIRFEAAQLAPLGPKPWAVSVAMIGDKALSNTAQMTID